MPCENAKIFRNLRLEALKEEPLSFGSSWEEESLKSVEEFAEEFWAQGKRCFVAVSPEGRYVGMAALALEGRKKKKHRATIQSVYVKKEFRGQKIAQALVEQIVAAAQEMKELEQLELSVVVDNIAAVKLYQKLGFVIYGKEPNSIHYNGKSLDQYLMYKKLSYESLS